MKATGKRWLATVAVVAGMLGLLTPRAAGVPMPEFGNSVQFDKAGPEISISQLRGKAVLVVFFQSWCGICNGWAPKMLKQVEEAHGNNRAVVLVAIKTDGGGLAGAKDYLKGKGADLTKWCVGSDEGAAYYKQVHGNDELWGYALVGADGEIVEQSKAGRYFTDGPDNGKYLLASADLFKSCGQIGTILPADKEYAGDSAKIARLAEFGCLGKALSMCNSAAQADIKQDILKLVDTRMRQHMDVLKDVSKDGASRYAAYKELGALAKQCPSLPVTTEANAMLSKANNAPVIQKERGAEAEYVALCQKMQKASKRDQPRLRKELADLGKKYPDTKYGKIAAAEGQATTE